LNTAVRDDRLGRDFWVFQAGQMISTVGDACGNIALAWWVLDVTQSPVNMSAVLAPAIVVQSVLTPVLGPLGDRFSRRRLIVGSDLLRAVAIAALAISSTRGVFSVPLVLAIYIPFVAGSALFNSNNMSIVPQLVPPDALQKAVRTSESLRAIGRVMGGIVAGLLISWSGVGAAFALDAVSFGIAAIATASIVEPRRHPRQSSEGLGSRRPVRAFVQELRGGFQVVHRIPVLFYLCIAIVAFNLVLSPMQILVPTYAKLSKAMPAWFLGGLESCLGTGIIIGAVTVGTLERMRSWAPSVILGLILVGGSMAMLPHVPGVVAPMGVMFLFGVGAAWTNIPIGTRVSVALPDHFRSRVNAIIAFLFESAGPIGVTAGGVLVAAFGVAPTITALGVVVLLLAPGLYWVGGFVEFFRRQPSQLTDHFARTYPEAFDGPASMVLSEPRRAEADEGG